MPTDRSPAAFWTLTGLALAALVLLAGCAGPPRDPMAARPRAVRIQVDNRSWSEVAIYASNDIARVRIGTVPAATERAFPLPRTIDPRQGLQLEAMTGLTQAYRSERILVDAGGRVTWWLENQAGVSSYAVVMTR